jgi:hypothetical protein
MKRTALCLIVLGFFSITALADSTQKAPRIIYKKKTSMDFQDAVIEGAVDNPEGLYLVTPPEKKFGGLLKLRPNFHRELMRDALLLM